MIEGCKHGPTDLVPQPCIDCARESVSSEGATHAIAGRLRELAQMGGRETENPSPSALSNLQSLGDLPKER